MSTVATPRTWDAVIHIAGEQVPADLSEHDLVRHQEHAALREAARMVEAGLADEARVELFKTTKARGREYDRNGGYVYRDERGRVCAVRGGL